MFHVRTKEDVLFIITVLLTGLAIQSVIIIGLRFIGETVKVAGITALVDPTGRIGGTVGGPNSAGSYLSFLLAPTMALMTTKTTRFFKVFIFCIIYFYINIFANKI